jgi:hypothetical protein
MLAADVTVALLAIAVVIVIGARSLVLRSGGSRNDPEPPTCSGGVEQDQEFFDREFAGIASNLATLTDRADAAETEALVRAFGGDAGLLRGVRPTAAPGTVSLVSETGVLHLRLSSTKEAARLCDIELSDGPASYTLNVGTGGAQIVIVTPNAQVTLRGEILPG